MKSKKVPLTRNPAVRVEAQQFLWGFYVEYLGNLHDLHTSGALPAKAYAMAKTRKNCTVTDSRGDTVRIHRRPTKADAWNSLVVRWIKKGNGLELPGVREVVVDQRPPEAPQPSRPTFSTEEKANYAADVLGQEQIPRARLVGRFRRSVSWYAVGQLVIPDWSSIRAQVEVARET